MHLRKIRTPGGKLRHLPAHLAPTGVLKIEPGDVIMLHSKDRLTNANIEQLGQGIKRIFPGHKVIVFQSGTTLTIVRPSGSTGTQAEPVPECHLRDLGLLTPETKPSPTMADIKPPLLRNY